MTVIDPIITYIIFFALAFLFSLLINRLLLKFVGTLGIRNSSETVIRWGSQSKPAIGGFSFYIVFLLSLVASGIMSDNEEFINIPLLGIILSSTLAFLIGLADDAYDTRPLLKFTGQIICGSILVFTGTIISITDSYLINLLFTVLWVVGIMNSINMLDNMDAVAGITSCTILLSALIVLFTGEGFSPILILIFIGLIGSLLGFLFYNWHPSKIYMGDTGSQFIGIILGIAGITYFWNPSQINSGELNYLQPILLTSIAFIVPLTDTTTVVINRLLKKQSPFIGGKDHTTHHLSYWGLSDRQVVLFLLAISLMSTGIISLISFEGWNSLTYILAFSFLLLVFFTLFLCTKIKKRATLQISGKEIKGNFHSHSTETSSQAI
jgi:UDP-GlcNAc:undecaprenyl-phosphate/decaprenyl-phosphate GlcNAc-1-phosphate transferase